MRVAVLERPSAVNRIFMADVSEIGSVSAWASVLDGWLEGCAAKSEMVYIKASNTIEITYKRFIHPSWKAMHGTQDSILSRPFGAQHVTACSACLRSECRSIDHVPVTGIFIDHILPGVIDLFGLDDLNPGMNSVVRTVVNDILCFLHIADQ